MAFQKGRWVVECDHCGCSLWNGSTVTFKTRQEALTEAHRQDWFIGAKVTCRSCKFKGR